MQLKEIDNINEAENDEYHELDLPETGNGKEINSKSIKEAAKSGERIQQKFKTLDTMKKRTPFIAQKGKLLILSRKVKIKVTTVMKAS